jgi:pimeloyl-ACP methyl ester carboxylesterase
MRAATSDRERLLAGVPVSERRLRAAGVSTAVLEGGAGPPLVLLHGGIECGGVYWAPLISRLAGDRRIIAPDVPGLGESDPVAKLDAAAFASWFDAVLDATCDEPPELIAHSLLGTAAARFAADHGERLASLVVYGAPGIGPYRMPGALRFAAIRFSLRPTPRNHERFERLAFSDLDRLRRREPEWLAAFSAYNVARAKVPHVKRTMGRLVRSETKQIPEADLRRIEVPTELVWGERDRFVPLGVASEAKTRLGWPLQVIEGAGHVAHIEQPDAFVRTTRSRSSRA